MAANGNSIACPGYMAPGAAASRLEWLGDVFGNNNYQIGGYNVTAAVYGMQGMEWWAATGPSNSGNFFLYPIWSNNASATEQRANTPANLLVKAYYQNNNNEVANNTNLAAEVWRVYVRGV